MSGSRSAPARPCSSPRSASARTRTWTSCVRAAAKPWRRSSPPTPTVVVVLGATRAPGQVRRRRTSRWDVRAVGRRPCGSARPAAPRPSGWPTRSAPGCSTRPTGGEPAATSCPGELDVLPEGAALLVIGDGSATRTPKAPGSYDPAGEAFDATVTAALHSGDPTRLAALDAAAQTAGPGRRGLARGRSAAGRHDVRRHVLADVRPSASGTSWRSGPPALAVELVGGLVDRLVDLLGDGVDLPPVLSSTTSVALSTASSTWSP